MKIEERKRIAKKGNPPIIVRDVAKILLDIGEQQVIISKAKKEIEILSDELERQKKFRERWDVQYPHRKVLLE